MKYAKFDKDEIDGLVELGLKTYLLACYFNLSYDLGQIDGKYGQSRNPARNEHVEAINYIEEILISKITTP